MGPFGLFMVALAFFHISEFSLTAIYNRKDLGWRCEDLLLLYCCRRCCAGRPAAFSSLAIIYG